VAVAALVALLENSDATARQAAAEALRKIKPPASGETTK
jgi:HEAT repeat protein